MLRRFILISVLVCASGENFRQLDGRIVGGEITRVKKFPHQVSIESDAEHICGGSIISKTVIVTAAHCMIDRNAKEMQVHSGATYKRRKGGRIAVKEIICHEDYDQVFQDNDIALLILTEPLQFSEKIQPIPLAESGEEPKVGAIAFVSGWGLLSEDGVAPEDLRYVAVNIIDTKKCKIEYEAKGFRIHKSMMCAGTAEGGKDACMEDSGGPLISGGKLVGVVSWGIGCAQKKYAGVYAKVSYLRDWIEKNRPDK